MMMMTVVIVDVAVVLVVVVLVGGYGSKMEVIRLIRALVQALCRKRRF